METNGQASQTGMWRPALLVAAVLGLTLVCGAAVLGWLAQAPPRQQRLAGYGTSLQGRTRNQRHNARLAARSLDGRVIPAGGVFSFNQTVNSWSEDQGYTKALVSYDGELVRAYGGGVCQTSTTLYNAALLAGLPILERHPHVFVPGYIAPGRDAAVAYPGIDLRFRNPYKRPIRIRARASGERLEIELIGVPDNPPRVQITTDVLSVAEPLRLTYVRYDGSNEKANRRGYLHSPGATGYRVVTYRTFSHPGEPRRRERLSDDTYPSMNRVVALTREAR